MAVELDGLEDFNSSSLLGGAPGKDQAADGHLLPISIDKITEDPDQPRKEFNKKKLQELAESIMSVGPTGKQRGIKSPLSVKPANEEGLHIINHGARRYRAAKLAGLSEVPAFIDDDHDDYAQTIENIQRENLTPLEIAHFVQKRIEAGDNKSEIAKGLGKPQSYVSDHVVFFDFADCIRDLYDSDRCRTIQALALLHRNYKGNKDAVERFCKGDNPITAALVRNFLVFEKQRQDSLNKPKDDSASLAGSNTIPGGSDKGGSSEPKNKGSKGDEGGTSNTASSGSNTSTAEGGTNSNPNNVVVRVGYNSRSACLLLDKFSGKGKGWIRYDDDGKEEEVILEKVYLVEVGEE